MKKLMQVKWLGVISYLLITIVYLLYVPWRAENFQQYGVYAKGIDQLLFGALSNGVSAFAWHTIGFVVVCLSWLIRRNIAQKIFFIAYLFMAALGIYGFFVFCPPL